MKKIYALISFKTVVCAVIAYSQLDLLNLIIGIIDDEIKITDNRCNCFRQHQAHQASGGIIECIDIMGVGYIGEPKPGSLKYSGIVCKIENGEKTSTSPLHAYMDDLIQDATRDLYDMLNTIA